jgi:thiol-disulfide isomerase/thioredoxin
MKFPQARMRSKELLAQRRKGTKVFPSFSFAPLRLCGPILLCSLLLLAGCNGTDGADSKRTPVISGNPPGTTYPMPPVKATSLVNMGWELADGRRSVVSDHKGKVLVLDFYATWCVPCRDSIPHLISLQKKFAEQGLTIVGLNVGGPDDPEKVPDFAKEFGIQYELAQPDDELVSFLLSDSDAIPQTFVFDREGKLVERFIGYDRAAGERLERVIEKTVQTPAS